MKLRLILFFSAVLGIASLRAQDAPSERLTIENGLSQGMIFDILQTRDGFLWVATKDGLNRYDGYNFKVFSNDPFDPFSISENTGTILFEDSRGWLWIGTESKGLDLYDAKTGRFHHFPLNFDKVYPEERVALMKIRETADGAIWVLRGGMGLVQIPIPEAWKNGLPEAPDLTDLTAIKPFPIALKQPEDDRIIEFDVRTNGELLVSSNFEQFTVNPLKGTCQSINEGLLPHYQVKPVLSMEGQTEVFWFLDSDKVSLLRNNVLRTYPTPASETGKRRALLTDKFGHVWIVLGVNIWDIAPGKAVDFTKPDLIIPERANCFKYDRNGNLWIGTLGYGFYKVYPAKKRFHSGARGTSIAGVWRTGKGRYYGKTYLSRISVFDPVSGKLEDQSAFPDAGAFQDCCAIDPADNTWILSSKDLLTSPATLRKYDADGHFVVEYALDTRLGNKEQLFCSRDGHLWIALGNCQLIRFDPVTAKRESFSFAHLFGDKAAAVRITALAEDGSGVLWLGTQLGLLKCTPKEQAFDFQLIQADAANPKGLNNNAIACLLADPVSPNSVLWIGTKGGGINRFDIPNQVCQHITMADGLPNNVVYGILSDRKNDLWCSTNRGLAKLTQRTGTSAPVFDITAFTVKMGLQDNEFNTSAYFKANNGEMLFGGVNGLNRFFPEELQSDTTSPPVFVVGLEINHLSAEKQLPCPVEMLRNLDLSYEQNNLSFEFAALDFTDPGKNRYRYRLVGLDEKWVETGGNRFAHFSHLEPGRYVFRVQGSNGESEWQETAHPIQIIVHPPWWRSNLAYLLYTALLLWLGWRGYQVQIQRVKMQEQHAFDVRETERIRILEQMKTNFFSNITHEFRTPLTLIIEPLRQLLKTPVSEQWRTQVQRAEGNSRKLLGLVNQLLDMAKLESGSMGVDLRHGDFLQTFRTVCMSFLHLADQRGIKFSTSAPKQIPLFDFDEKKVEIILNNLISNALKFTPDGGQVSVACQSDGAGDANSMEAEAAGISVVVRDTGIGIPAESLHKIFDRFYQVDGSNTRAVEGTGIGLSLSKELAELLGGRISVKSTVGEGSVFEFWMPVRHKYTLSAPGLDMPTDDNALKQEPSQQGGAETGIALIIEDNAELRGFIKQSIMGFWQVLEASNGAEGLVKAQELLPDIVVSDVMMPVKDGYDVCHELKTNELTAHIPVILLTAKSGLDAKIKGLRIGADDYLTKPFNTDELLARMENLVTTRRKLRAQFGKQAFVDATTTSDAFLSPPDRAFLRKLNLIIEQYLSDESLEIEALAQKLDISRMQLHRKLKALSDQSATEYIRTYRLERSMALLKNQEGNVKQVAAMVGFVNEKYFSRTFKEHFGVSPSEI